MFRKNQEVLVNGEQGIIISDALQGVKGETVYKVLVGGHKYRVLFEHEIM